jgi:phage anti-repressor protein
MDLTSEIVLSLIQSQEDFPIDLDDAWRWIGWAKKQKAKDVLTNNFEEGIDFLPKGFKSSTGGRSSEWILLTIDCFKSLAMMAGTERGKQVRKYFLECESKLKEMVQEQKRTVKERLIGAIVSSDAISRYPKFDDEFYELLYKKRGNGWEKRDPKKRPSCVANWTNETVYNRLYGGVEPGGVKDRLNQVNPIRDNGRRKDLHHWHFDRLGEFHIAAHLTAVKAIARLSPDGDWDRFLYNIRKGLPNGETLQLSLLSYLSYLENSDFA